MLVYGAISTEGVVCWVTSCSPSPVKLILCWHEEKVWITRASRLQHQSQGDIAVTYIEK